MNTITPTPLKSELLMGYGRAGCGVTQKFDHAIPTEAVAQMFAWEAVECSTSADFMGQSIPIPGKKALVRIPGGQVLGTPSTKYQAHNYETSLLGGVQRILGGGLAIDAAGMTGFGAKAWISVSLADTVCTPEGVEFLPRLFGMGSHDSTIATTYKRGALTMICNNQMTLLHRDHTGRNAGFAEVKVRHTANSILRLESAQEALGILASVEDDLSEQIRLLCQEEVTRKQFDALVETLVPMAEEAGRGRTMAENKREGVTAMYLNDPRAATWLGTSFGALQAFNTWERYEATVRGADRAERNQERDLTNYWADLDSTVYEALQQVRVTA